MGLLDAIDIIRKQGKQFINDAMPGGLLNPEVPPGGPTEVAKGLLGFTPGVGDAISAYDAVQSARQGNYGEAALNGLGVLPFVPSMAGVLRAETKAAFLKELERSKGRGVELDKPFTKESAPLSNVPYGQRLVDGEYNPRPKEVLLDNSNGFLHFAEEEMKKGYKAHRFVKTQDGKPVSVMTALEVPEREHGWSMLPPNAKINYAFTDPDKRGLGHASSLIHYADSRLPVQFNPDYWNSPDMLKAMSRAISD